LSNVVPRGALAPALSKKSVVRRSANRFYALTLVRLNDEKLADRWLRPRGRCRPRKEKFLVNSDTSGPFGRPADHKLLSLLRQLFLNAAALLHQFDVVAVRAPLSAALDCRRTFGVLHCPRRDAPGAQLFLIKEKGRRSGRGDGKSLTWIKVSLLGLIEHSRSPGSA